MIDLHMHSQFSNDGEFSPLELAEKCAMQGIDIMSVCDHNTVRAVEEAIAAAKARGIVCIPGIEIDCVYENTNFHVLGYGIHYQAPVFGEIEENVRVQGQAASRLMLEKTNELGFHVTEEDMRILSDGNYWSEIWTGEMFAEFLLSRPEYEGHALLQPYRPGGARSDNPYVNFYWDFYSQGKPCYAEIHYPAMKDIVELIHENNGCAVLAHPHVNLKGKSYLLEGIIGLGIDGIEVFSSYHTPEQAAQSLCDVKKHHLFATCGSDFHGKTKPAIHLGQHGCTEPELEMEMKTRIASAFQ